MENLSLMISSVFGGGALATIINILVNKRKTDADAHNTYIDTMLKAEERFSDRMSTRMADLEARVAALERENYELRKENLELKTKNPASY